jgi:hypothetical protein
MHLFRLAMGRTLLEQFRFRIEAFGRKMEVVARAFGDSMSRAQYGEPVKAAVGRGRD